MIQHLHLENWKSYDSLDIDFSAGTTFVVAPNGVGKTSIVEALAWAVYGDHARSVSPRDCIRAGADLAAVSVTIRLADGATLTVQRTVKRRGSPAAAYQLDSEPMDGDAAEERLRSEYGIDLATAARLTVTPGGGHLAADKALDLQGHLHEAFGVATLLRSNKEANRILKEARKETASLKAADSQGVSDRDAVEAEIKALEQQLSEA
ncbi:MAG TPA: ATP-binding protein, partial [Acidimicrobiia bacterium]